MTRKSGEVATRIWLILSRTCEIGADTPKEDLMRARKMCRVPIGETIRDMSYLLLTSGLLGSSTKGIECLIF